MANLITKCFVIGTRGGCLVISTYWPSITGPLNRCKEVARASISERKDNEVCSMYV